jgi:hypothetical protein
MRGIVAFIYDAATSSGALSLVKLDFLLGLGYIRFQLDKKSIYSE